MNILQVSAELFPLIKTGGLADVTGALPAALEVHGCDVRALLPGYPEVWRGFSFVRDVGQFQLPWGETARIVYGTLAQRIPGYVIDLPSRFNRSGNPYEDAFKQPYSDNHLRFAALSWAGAHLARGLDQAWQPNIVHAHDWHAGLVAACLDQWTLAPGQAPVKTVFTIHNLAYQGLYGRAEFDALGLRPESFGMDGLEFHGCLSFIKAGIYYSDLITTVSPRYAQEIQTSEQGCGLEGLLHARRNHLVGILNGVDDRVWNPAHDSLITAQYDARHLKGKLRCKQALLKTLHLEQQTDRPLIGVVSRLTEQKGMNLVLEAIDPLIHRGAQWVVLGSGDPWLESAFLDKQQKQANHIHVHRGYDESLAHQIFSGCDLIVVPSRFEPCGLTQLYGLAYGCVPVVRRVGGLADTVVDANANSLAAHQATGFTFDAFETPALLDALHRALDAYGRPDWTDIQQAGMSQAFSWHHSAGLYAQHYATLLRSSTH